MSIIYAIPALSTQSSFTLWIRFNQGFFLDIVKKTQAQKNSKLKQNLEKKLKQNPEKTQKPPTPVEFRWWNFFYKP